MNYKEKASHILDKCLGEMREIERHRFLRMKRAKRWATLFPYLSVAEQFEVLTYEVLDSIENHKNRLTHFGRKAFNISELKKLYLHYYQALLNFDKFPFTWFGDAVQRHDIDQIAQLLCYIEIQRLKHSLPYLRHDLEAIKQEKSVLQKKMRYHLNFLGATISFKNFTQESIQIATVNDFLNIILTPFEGKYKNKLANYLLDNQIIAHKEHKNQETHDGLFAQNLAISLAHYKANKSLTKSVEFKAELQGGAGKLIIDIYPSKRYLPTAFNFPLLSLASYFVLGISWLVLTFSSISLLGLGVNFFLLAFLVFSYFNQKKNVKSYEEMFFRIEQIERSLENTALPTDKFSLILQSIEEKMVLYENKDESMINTSETNYFYKLKLDFIKRIGNSQFYTTLKEHHVFSKDDTYLSGYKYILFLRLAKSAKYFEEIFNSIIHNRIEAIIHIKLFKKNISTHNLYSIFFDKDAHSFSHQEWQDLPLEMPQTCHTLPEFAEWVMEKEREILDYSFEADVAQFLRCVELYKASRSEKVPFILNFDEIALYF